MACLAISEKMSSEGVVEHGGVVHRAYWLASRGAYLLCDTFFNLYSARLISWSDATLISDERRQDAAQR